MVIRESVTQANVVKARRVAGPRVLVMVCTFNEAGNLPTLLSAIATTMPDADVLVIDDDSPDGTGKLACEIAQNDSRLRVMIRRNQRGLGSAIRVGLQQAIENDYDFVVNMDADFSHTPEDLPRLLEAATQTDVWIDVTIGSRYVDAGRIVGWPWHRKLMSRLVNRFATAVLRLPVRDCSGGLRCYRVNQLRQINLSLMQSDGYSIQQELLLRLRETDASMRELPIVFTERLRGSSKLSIGEAAGSIWQLLRMAAR